MTDQTTSEERRTRNRANFLKSTGPRTPQGKARVSRNAVKHGLLTAHITLGTDDPDDDPADFKVLLDGLMDQFQPQHPLERLLVERIAGCYWRLRRAYRFESKSVADSREYHLTDAMAVMGRQMLGKKADPAQFVLPETKDLERLVRYESLIDRELYRCTAQLERIQARTHRDPLNQDAERENP